jgi:hypothetical protein
MSCYINNGDNCSLLINEESCVNCQIFGCYWNEVAIGGDRCQNLGPQTLPIEETDPGDEGGGGGGGGGGDDINPRPPSQRNPTTVNSTNRPYAESNNITGEIESIDNLKPAEYNVRQRRNLRHRETNSEEIITDIPYLTYNNPYIKIISIIGLFIILFFISYYLIIKKKYI